MQSKFTYQNSGGVRRTILADAANPDQFKVFTEVQMDDVLASIKQAREEHPSKSVNKLLARVPMTVYERSVHEEWDDDDWKKWLNDPDNAAFRVWPGRV